MSVILYAKIAKFNYELFHERNSPAKRIVDHRLTKLCFRTWVVDQEFIT